MCIPFPESMRCEKLMPAVRLGGGEWQGGPAQGRKKTGQEPEFKVGYRGFR